MGRRAGKLRSAARWLITPAAAADPEDDAEAEASLARLGVPPEQLEAVRRERTAVAGDDAADAADTSAEVCEVWAWHMDAVRLFEAACTQWRVVPLHGRLHYVGLDYAALPELRRGLRLRASAELQQQLRTMERAALRALNSD